MSLKTGKKITKYNWDEIPIPQTVINRVITVCGMGISSEISPHSILTGESLDYKKKLTLQPVQYCQVHENKGPSNSDKNRTQGFICLGPCGNLQG